ncbi:hypothetical protein LOTGIDRAFT_118829 [Lottia gigantea]|uniref:CHHC U11-48K-type domain-containing protein n=1 Tax=Lottia gigantea TaxID=225164 RepID=V4AL82_LOTGI|nr:hypothetical protein LOTGIDRAFT_118829 [Lottia gigantea]ESO94331.1 hypothetical protein LOTGIDRAFT_118829 [Lottia gigantea]
MADYDIDDPEREIECPYDKAHMVRKKRMQYHLIKCRRNHVTKDFVTCPFNATHEMPRPELRHHMLTCRDRAVAEKTIRHGESLYYNY